MGRQSPVCHALSSTRQISWYPFWSELSGVQQVAELADKRRAANENLEAAAIYQEVARLQRQLNEKYRGSPYASSERVSEYQRRAASESFEPA